MNGINSKDRETIALKTLVVPLVPLDELHNILVVPGKLFGMLKDVKG